MPRSCEDFRLKHQYTNRRLAHFSRKKLTNSYVNYHFEHDSEIGENVIIDIDGGGPLKPFQVTCLEPLSLKNFTTNNATNIKINAKKIVKDEIKQKLMESKLYSKSNNEDEYSNEELIGQYNNDDFVNINIKNEEDENEVTFFYNMFKYFKLITINFFNIIILNILKK